MGMNSTALEPLNIEGEQLALLLEVLESAHARMLVGIRHTDHRLFRHELRHRLEVVEQLIERCPHKPVLEPRP
jgi:Holliday junction resolvase